jgi:hypothetical protein
MTVPRRFTIRRSVDEITGTSRGSVTADYSSLLFSYLFFGECDFCNHRDSWYCASPHPGIPKAAVHLRPERVDFTSPTVTHQPDAYVLQSQLITAVATFISTAPGLLKIAAVMMAPCSVKASEGFRRPPQLDVAKCDFKLANSLGAELEKKIGRETLALSARQKDRLRDALKRYERVVHIGSQNSTDRPIPPWGLGTTRSRVAISRSQTISD